jgi:hypothetical protein
MRSSRLPVVVLAPGSGCHDTNDLYHAGAEDFHFWQHSRPCAEASRRGELPRLRIRSRDRDEARRLLQCHGVMTEMLSPQVVGTRRWVEQRSVRSGKVKQSH